MPRVIGFDALATSDLYVDAIYEGGTANHAGSDALQKLLGVGNAGGFRMKGSVRRKDVRLCVLYSQLSDPDWPDSLSPEAGTFRYYGDNKTPGKMLHETPRLGNLFLKQVFEATHVGERHRVPPILVFTKGAKGRDVVFRGLAVPGTRSEGQHEDLVAIWRTRGGERFQNYRAVFTILDEPSVPRAWLASCLSGEPDHDLAPASWLQWRSSGSYKPLVAPRTTEVRSLASQLPTLSAEMKLLERLVRYFKDHPRREYAFEAAAGRLFEMMDANVEAIDYTQPWRDGGRDATGVYRIGTARSRVRVEFALEAKCKAPSTGNSSGVREVSRLISRLRHRQFGIFVTTSCVGTQAYKEVVEDGHPVLFLCGVDIIDILRDHGRSTPASLDEWLAEVAPY